MDADDEVDIDAIDDHVLDDLHVLGSLQGVAADDEGNTPLLKAMKFKNIDYVKLLVEHPNTDIFVQNYKSQTVFDLEKEGSYQVYR